MLGAFLLLEGLGIVLFSNMDTLVWAIIAMLAFALFLKMANGATYSVVPFINQRAMGAVSGIVGAGGNVGAVLAGFLFTSETVTYRESLFVIGIAVTLVSLVALFMAFNKSESTEPAIKNLEPVLEKAIA